MYVVSNKVEDEEFESEAKTGNGSSFSHYDILAKNRKNCQNGTLILVSQKFAHIAYWCVIFDKVDHEKFESEEKTGNFGFAFQVWWWTCGIVSYLLATQRSAYISFVVLLF